MDIDTRKKFLKRTEEKLTLLPWYVEEFIDYIARSSSPSTLLNYSHDYLSFFQWLINDNLFDGALKEMPLEVLETLRIQHIHQYQNFLALEQNNSDSTIARKLSSLKALFHYLSQIAEDENLYPYLRRNVMAKVEIHKERITPRAKAARIQGKILQDEEYEEFRSFIALDYGRLVQDNKRLYNAYLRNRDRDLAIVSLILGSGLRVSEVVSINCEDIDWKQANVNVIRKGNKKDRVWYSEAALRDMQEYNLLRKERYKVDDTVKPFFLSSPTGPKGKVGRLTVRAVQKMVEKYVQAFGKPALSVHKLRHSFATKYHLENNDLARLKDQLGHSDINTTMIYTHITDHQMKESVDKADN